MEPHLKYLPSGDGHSCARCRASIEPEKEHLRLHAAGTLALRWPREAWAQPEPSRVDGWTGAYGAQPSVSVLRKATTSSTSAADKAGASPARRL